MRDLVGRLAPFVNLASGKKPVEDLIQFPLKRVSGAWFAARNLRKPGELWGRTELKTSGSGPAHKLGIRRGGGKGRRPTGSQFSGFPVVWDSEFAAEVSRINDEGSPVTGTLPPSKHISQGTGKGSDCAVSGRENEITRIVN